MNPKAAAPDSSALDRVAAGFVLVLLALGALALWTVVPLGTAWVVAQVTDSNTHFVVTLIAIPLAMLLFAPLLLRLNELYLRIRTGTDEGRGPIEPLLLISFALAVIALLVWFFIFADNPELAAF